jgi:hypothetical protein
MVGVLFGILIGILKPRVTRQVSYRTKQNRPESTATQSITFTMATWKIIPDPSEAIQTQHKLFLQSRKFFAVDDSGSTAGAILRQQRAFVEYLHSHYTNPGDAVALWGSSCDAPAQNFSTINWTSGHGGTQPSTILQNSAALTTIKTSDVWFLLTDGEIWGGDVHRLADLATQHDVLNVPLVFVITGGKGTTPSATNISVGISFFASAQDTLILFKETATGKIYVIAGKGCFQPLVGQSEAAKDLESWEDVPVFADEADFFTCCGSVDVRIVEAECRRGFAKGVSLGSEWEEREGDRVQVDLDLLLKAGSLSDEDLSSVLSDEAFDTLAIAYKTRSCIAELRAFVQRQKIEQIAPKLEDVAGATDILAQMGTLSTAEEQRKNLQQHLREAHIKNREHYQTAISSFTGSDKEKKLKKRNQLVDAALRSLASIEAADFSASILSRKSNRARRADTVDSTPIDLANLDLDAPSCRGFCHICCGEDEVLSICFKAAPAPDAAEDNTTDFALNFPLAAGAFTRNVDLVSSQNICFQCALLVPEGRSIYQECLTAVVPAVMYAGGNKKYINEQLYLGLTNGLATGAAGIAQHFMAVLRGVMEKRWAGGGGDGAVETIDDGHDEVGQRRRTFQWMLDHFVGHTFTREDFKEGDWVAFPKALEWVARDFEANGLSSFAVTYPQLGFGNLLALGSYTGAFGEDILGRMHSAKTVYSVAAKYLSEMQGARDTKWKQKYCELIYRDCNGFMVPVDQGADSLVTDAETFKKRLSACLDQTPSLDASEIIMRKVQLILFWFLFNRSSHCTAQTLFKRLAEMYPLAPSVLNPKLVVPEPECTAILLSIFATQSAPLINPTLASLHEGLIPFANPFGASVLHCGATGCSEVFCDLTKPEDVTSKSVNAIRDARRKHLVEVFGIRGRFEDSQTGLPESSPPLITLPPTSVHTNLHISIARHWAEQTQDQKKSILDDGGEREVFVRGVREELCRDGRGDVFQKGLDGHTRASLSSFFKVLRKALDMLGKGGEGVEAFEHGFEENTLEGKVRWEMEAGELEQELVQRGVEAVSLG